MYETLAWKPNKKKEGFLNTHYIIYNATHKGRTKAAAARSTSSEPKGSYYHLNEKAQAASGLVKLVAATSDVSERYLNFPHNSIVILKNI